MPSKPKAHYVVLTLRFTPEQFARVQQVDLQAAIDSAMGYRVNSWSNTCGRTLWYKVVNALHRADQIKAGYKLPKLW